MGLHSVKNQDHTVGIGGPINESYERVEVYLHRLDRHTDELRDTACEGGAATISRNSAAEEYIHEHLHVWRTGTAYHGILFHRASKGSVPGWARTTNLSVNSRTR